MQFHTRFLNVCNPLIPMSILNKCLGAHEFDNTFLLGQSIKSNTLKYLTVLIIIKLISSIGCPYFHFQTKKHFDEVLFPAS